LAELAPGQGAPLVHASAIECIERPTLAEYGNDVSLPNHLDSLAFDQRIAIGNRLKSHSRKALCMILKWSFSPDAVDCVQEIYTIRVWSEKFGRCEIGFSVQF
jgi:hypothetical protein